VEDRFLWLALFAGYVVTILIGGVGGILIWKMYKGTIDLSMLISEKNGQASLSRLQFLIFTFVIAASLLLLVLGNLSNGEIAFPAIGDGVLMLLGISGGSYVVSKGIQKNAEKNEKEGAGDTPAAPDTPAEGWTQATEQTTPGQ
jgi:hypothetical protein